MNNSTPITMKDIAKALGISVATVSRALKDSPSISKDRRELVQAYAKEHNFTPNMMAEGLRHTNTKPQKLIGVIMPQFVHYYFSSVLSGIEDEASKRGYRIIAAQSNEEFEREVKICQTFYETRVCGVIVSQAKNTATYDHFKQFLDRGTPVVFYDRICTKLDASRVVVDDYAGAKNAIAYLIKQGCRNIAFMGSGLHLEIAKNRFNGYRDALQEARIPYNNNMVLPVSTMEEAMEILPSLMTPSGKEDGEQVIPDAFFCINDGTAIGVLHAAKRLGIRIPDDLSIIGFGNDLTARSCDPLLTTVEQRGVELGREAADILIQKVEGIIPRDKIEKRVVRTKLIVRGTTTGN